MSEKYQKGFDTAKKYFQRINEHTWAIEEAGRNLRNSSRTVLSDEVIKEAKKLLSFISPASRQYSPTSLKSRKG